MCFNRDRVTVCHNHRVLIRLSVYSCRPVKEAGTKGGSIVPGLLGRLGGSWIETRPPHVQITVMYRALCDVEAMHMCAYWPVSEKLGPK